MIKRTQKDIEETEKRLPGFKGNLYHFENLELPPCPRCHSTDTASVQAGFVRMSMMLAGATTKFHLIFNPNGWKYFCNTCRKYFFKTKPTFRYL